MNWSEMVGAALLGLAGLGSTAMVLRRRLSADAAAIAKNEVETTFAKQLMHEREASMVRARERALLYEKALETIARLEVRDSYREADIVRMQEEFASFKRKLGRMYPQTREFLESEFAPLDPVPLLLPRQDPP